MHVHEKTERVRLIHRSGAFYEYASIVHLATEVGGAPEHFGLTFDQERTVWAPVPVYYRGEGVPPDGFQKTVVPAEVSWVARTESGEVVTADDIVAFVRRRRSWWEKRRLAAVAAAERGLPIPRTGRNRYDARHDRCPRTVQQHRQAVALATDMEDCPVPLAQTGRVRKMRWSPYDEGPFRADHRDRTWKRHRSTQWRERGQAQD